MNVYLVGGAVRDALLGIKAGDRDWLVVGQTPEQLVAAGFTPVGSDFPVFLHPRTGEEYALARTERKTAPGYKGFVFHADSSVTLEQDLARRDFTINAIAQSEDGQLIDPYNGKRDLELRILRHVSPAFAEDPVRILRAARFMARFADLGFTIAPETLELMRQMVLDGEVNHLVPERVWQEIQSALRTKTPSAFLQTLRACGALAVILPEVNALYGVPQRAEFHPEIDTGTHTEMVLDMAARLAPGDSIIGFAALTHDLGKALDNFRVVLRILFIAAGAGIDRPGLRAQRILSFAFGLAFAMQHGIVVHDVHQISVAKENHSLVPLNCVGSFLENHNRKDDQDKVLPILFLFQ